MGVEDDVPELRQYFKEAAQLLDSFHAVADGRTAGANAWYCVMWAWEVLLLTKAVLMSCKLVSIACLSSEAFTKQ